MMMMSDLETESAAASLRPGVEGGTGLGQLEGALPDVEPDPRPPSCPGLSIWCLLPAREHEGSSGVRQAELLSYLKESLCMSDRH